jgi:multidrug resistance efflux pump
MLPTSPSRSATSARRARLGSRLARALWALVRVSLTLVVVAAGCLGACALWDRYMYSPWTRDARIQADVVSVAPDVSGFVQEIRVKDNQVVHKGDALFVLDQERYKLAVATAEAAVESRRAAMEMQQRVAARRAQLTDLAASAEERENARYSADGAVAAYDQALAELAVARLNLARTVVAAPVNGFVTNLTLVNGQFAPVGASVMAIIDADSYRVSGYFEETKIPRLKLGQRVAITLMSGGAALAGHIESISRGITDRDNPKGPDLLAAVTPTFEWVRLAQRIPVRIHIDSAPDGVLISSGMTCTVVADTPPRETNPARSALELAGRGWALLSDLIHVSFAPGPA